MSYLRKAAVKQTTQTLGTSNIVLLPNDGDTRSFEDALGAGPISCRYMFRGPGFFQHGRGTFTAPDQLTRDAVIKSSSGDAEVSIPSGTTDVYLLDYEKYPLDKFSSARTLTNKDATNALIYTGASSVALTLPASATLLPDYWNFVRNDGTGNLTLTPDGADTIDSGAILYPGQSCDIYYDAGWKIVRNAAPSDHCFAVQKTASQSVTTATFTKVTFATELSDPANKFASNEFTISRAGLWEFEGYLLGSSSSALTLILASLYKNGAEILAGARPGRLDKPSGNTATLPFSFRAVLALNDVIALWTILESAGTIDVTAGQFSGRHIHD